MKKIFFSFVLIVITLTLFSFRSVENKSFDTEMSDVKEFMKEKKSFTEAYRVFPSQFTAYRRVWTAGALEVSLEEMNSVLLEY